MYELSKQLHIIEQSISFFIAGLLTTTINMTTCLRCPSTFVFSAIHSYPFIFIVFFANSTAVVLSNYKSMPETIRLVSEILKERILWQPLHKARPLYCRLFFLKESSSLANIVFPWRLMREQVICGARHELSKQMSANRILNQPLGIWQCKYSCCVNIYVLIAARGIRQGD